MPTARKYSDKELNNNSEINPSNYVDTTHSESKVFFWEKWASTTEGDEDKFNFYEIENDPRIREVIRNFESRIIGDKVLFSDIKTKNPSVKKWINVIRESYPERKDDFVEYLLDTFRGSLHTASKKKYKYIVGLLLLDNVLLIIHSKKESSLAELKDEMHPVDIVLHPKNVLRTAIIKNEDGKTTFSVFEYSKRMIKGHANFWGIKPEDVSWDSLGNIFLSIEIENFPYPIQLPVESEQLDEMIKDNKISPRGSVKIGKEEGRITKAQIYQKYMDFEEFYDFYITEKEKLAQYRKKFKEIMKTTLDDFPGSEIKYKYKDDVDKLYEINLGGDELVFEKTHPRYNLCFFTKVQPRIKPSPKFTFKLSESIFENSNMEIWHAGEETCSDPLTIGNLNIYNKIDVNRDVIEFSDKLLDIIQDTRSSKEKFLIQSHFCSYWKLNIKNKHLRSLFDFLKESIKKDLEYEFENKGIFTKESDLEFKSADDVVAKPSRFAQKLVETVKGYVSEKTPKRLCILYGFEDNGEIQPLYNRFKNDNAPTIEKKANSLLIEDGIQVNVQPIPFKEGIIAAVFIIPIID